jgi:predicted RNA-binding protein with PUA-like domain
MPRHWLMKSEPKVYSIKDLEREGRTYWDGIRNYQARNFMRDDMKQGDLVLFYHSNTRPTGVAGVAVVAREAYPDFTAWDPASDYYDARSTPDSPLWLMVDIQFRKKLPRVVTLDEIREEPSLQDMVLVQNSRLSIQPVKPEEFERILAMAGERSG